MDVPVSTVSFFHGKDVVDNRITIVPLNLHLVNQFRKHAFDRCYFNVGEAEVTVDCTPYYDELTAEEAVPQLTFGCGVGSRIAAGCLANGTFRLGMLSFVRYKVATNLKRRLVFDFQSHHLKGDLFPWTPMCSDAKDAYLSPYHCHEAYPHTVIFVFVADPSMNANFQVLARGWYNLYRGPMPISYVPPSANALYCYTLEAFCQFMEAATPLKWGFLRELIVGCRFKKAGTEAQLFFNDMVAYKGIYVRFYDPHRYWNYGSIGNVKALGPVSGTRTWISVECMLLDALVTFVQYAYIRDNNDQHCPEYIIYRSDKRLFRGSTKALARVIFPSLTLC